MLRVHMEGLAESKMQPFAVLSGARNEDGAPATLCRIIEASPIPSPNSTVPHALVRLQGIRRVIVHYDDGSVAGSCRGFGLQSHTCVPLDDEPDVGGEGAALYDETAAE